MTEPKDGSVEPSRDSGRPQMPAAYGIEPAATEGVLPWSYAEQNLLNARNYWLASTRPDGRPHVMPVWGLWLDGQVYFSTDPSSRKARNFTANPHCVVHLESGDEVVILEGTVEKESDAGILARFADAYEAKYGIRVDTSNPDYGVYRVRYETVLAWREADFQSTATRWQAGSGRS